MNLKMFESYHKNLKFLKLGAKSYIKVHLSL